MWWGTEPDPGGSQASGPSSEQQELNELKDQAEQQQKLIVQLKEMLRKTDQIATSESLEKAEKLTSTLSKMQSRAKKNKEKKLLERDDDKSHEEKSQIDTPGKKKVNLLRKQLEENRAKLAERDKHQKGIEDKVTQLKAQLDDSQALVNQSLSNISFNRDIKTTPSKSIYSIDSSNEELFSLIVEKDKHIDELNQRIEQLEANVLDLQENLKEKDSVIEARTKAITLMSEDLSRRGKSTLDMLDETKEQMRLMQNNFIKLEDDMKIEKQKIIDELDNKNKYTQELEESNKSLNEKLKEFELEMSSLSELNEQLKIDNRLNSEHIAEKDKIIQELQEKVNKSNDEDESTSLPKSKKALKKEFEIIRNENVELKEKIFNLEKQQPSCTESNNNDEIEKLTKQLDEMNKSMIKLKAQNKSKIKELQKQVDVFKKADDINVELLKINAENNKLKQTIVELEEEKGNLQLNLVAYDSKSVDTNMQNILSDLKEKLEELKTEVIEKDKMVNSVQKEKNKLSKEMESQKIEFDSMQKRILELSQMEAEHVKTQMTSAHLEEQIDQLKVKNEDLTQQVSVISKENIALHERIETIISEKQELNTKLENLIHENIDLVDRLEKLSAEKVSSAESIEIVESLTQQEKLEIEEFNQKYNEPDSEDIRELEQNPELNDSVKNLTEESAELMEKIELFTIERKEVMEKMEHLTMENNQLTEKLKLIEQEKLQLEETYETLFDSKTKIEQELDDLKVKSGKSDNVEEFSGLEEQIAYYKNLVNDQEKEIFSLNEELSKNQRLLEELGIEKATIDCTLQEIIKEKDEISQSLNETINKIKNYDEKISENDSLINSLKNELNYYNNRIQQTETLLHEKDLCISEIEQQKKDKEIENNKLKNEIQTIIGNFQTKYRELETKIESNNETTLLQNEIENLQKQCSTLDSTNKEQLQRMKKIAAHLKKKTTTCEELEKELEHDKQIIESKAVELNNARIQIEKISNLKDELEHTIKSQTTEIENAQFEIKKISDISTQQINDLTGKIEYLTQKLNEENEKKKLQVDGELIKLQEELRMKDQKQQEQEMIIENIELEKNRYFNKNSELAESLSIIQNENQNLQITIQNFREQLQEKVDSLDESVQAYRRLEEELLKATSITQQLNQKIDELTIENQELFEQNKINNENIHTLQHQLNMVDEKYKKENCEVIDNLEDLNNKLKSQVTHLENELTKAYSDLKNENEQLEKLEYESSVQYEEFNNERKKIIEINERLNHELNNMKQRLNEIENENKYLCEQNKEISHINDDEIHKLQTIIDNKNVQIEKMSIQINEYQKVLNDNEQKYINLIEQYKNEEMHYKKAITELQEENLQKNFTIEENYKKLISELHEQVDNLQQQLSVEKIAEHEVTNIIQIAEESVIKRSEVNQLQSQNIEHDLNGKIKTLQFMLHDSEKTKEDVLEMCQGLLNEIAWRDYENNKNTKQELKKDDEVTHDVLKAIENEIVTFEGEEIIKKDEKSQSSQLFASDIHAHEEEVITCKKAYKCFTEDDENLILDSEDNFWGSEEAKLEDVHIQNTTTAVLESKIKEIENERGRLLEEIKQLQSRSNKMLKKLKEFKEKNDKLTNQLKQQSDDSFNDLNMAIEDELKSQIITLEKQVKELKCEKEQDNIERKNLLRQIEVLTATNERMSEKQHVEVQFLQSRNKELNDKINQLEWGVDDTIIESTSSPKQSEGNFTDLQKQINELNAKVNDLSIDNEEMQCLLEEQVQLRKEAEKKVAELRFNTDSKQLWEDYNLLVKEKNKLILELKNIKEEKQHDIISDEKIVQLEQERNSLLEKYNVLLEEIKMMIPRIDFKNLQDEFNNLQLQYTKRNDDFDMLAAEKNYLSGLLDQMKFEHNDLVLQLNEKIQLCNELTAWKTETELKLDDMTRIQNDQMSTLHTKAISYEQELKLKENEIKELKHQIEIQKVDTLQTFEQELKIKESNIQELKNQIEVQKVGALQTFEQELRTKENEIQELRTQLDIQKVEALDTLKISMESWAAEVDKRGLDVAESWKAHLEKREYEFSQLETLLRNEITTLEAKYSTLLENKTETEIQQSESKHERQMLNQTILSLQNKLEEMENTVKNMEVLQQENQKLSQDIQELNDSNMYYKNEMDSTCSVIEVKDAQIEQLNYELTQLKEKLNHNELRINEMTQKNDENLKLNDYIENLERHLKENEIQIQNLNVAINMKNEDIIKLKEDISKKEITLENEQIEKLNNEINELRNLISIADEKYLQLMNEKSSIIKENQDYVELIKLKDIEIQNLSISINENNNKIQCIENETDNEIQDAIREKENEIEMIKYEKENEIQDIKNEKENVIQDLKTELNKKTDECNNLRIQLENYVPLHEEIKKLNETITARQNDLINLQSQLHIKSQQCTELENKIAELDYIINEDTTQMSDLKDIIETQVLKIEKLKTTQTEEIQQQQEKVASEIPEKHVHFPETELVTQHYYERQADSSPNDELIHSQEIDSGSELVSRDELEIALYMLHQRDVRCEELTVELTQLLEERDTLQLRLSNSIRMNEELRRRISPRKLKNSDASTSIESLTSVDNNATLSTTPIRKSKSSDILIGATGAEIAKEATEEHDEDMSIHTQEMAYLENKLSELQSIDHRRDVRLKDEKEARHLQLSLVQQHRDLSLLPAEAAARLVDANYTLSRESESASTVLLNWLWGKSTPKINHL